jgi:itaconate CoA-transferase
MSSHFVWVNRSKESLSLDLKHVDAQAIVYDLLSRADVFVQNLAPGAAARLGFSAKELRARFPRLIVCDISGYGYDGPYYDRKAYDLLVQSEAGFLSVTGTPDTMTKAGISVADIAAGMYAYSGILAALLARAQTGLGSHIDVTMLEALAEWMGFPMYYAYDGAPPPVRAGASHATIFPYGPFAAGDGGTIMVGLQNEREWTNFCRDVLQDTSLETDARFATSAQRSMNRDQLTEIIEAVFAEITVAEIARRLDTAAIANARVLDMQGLWDHPQLAARNRWQTIDSPSGPITQLRPPANNDTFDARMDAIPAVGQHTDAILAEFGKTPADIASLRAAGAI